MFLAGLSCERLTLGNCKRFAETGINGLSLPMISRHGRKCGPHSVRRRETAHRSQVGDLAKLGADLAAVRAEAAAAVARADAAERARDVAEAERDHWRRMAETLAADRPKPRWRLRWPWELSE